MHVSRVVKGIELIHTHLDPAVLLPPSAISGKFYINITLILQIIIIMSHRTRLVFLILKN